MAESVLGLLRHGSESALRDYAEQHGGPRAMAAWKGGDARGMGALHVAAASGNVAAQVWLVQVCGVRPNVPDRKGRVALYYAIRGFQWTAALALLDLRAEVSAPLLALSCRLSVLTPSSQKRYVDAGEVASPPSGRRHWDVEAAYLYFLKRIAQAVDKTAVANLRPAPLALAVERALAASSGERPVYRTAVSVLLEANLNPNVPAVHRPVPLVHVCLRERALELSRLLFSFGVDPAVTDADGHSARDVAVEVGFGQLVPVPLPDPRNLAAVRHSKEPHFFGYDGAQFSDVDEDSGDFDDLDYDDSDEDENKEADRLEPPRALNPVHIHATAFAAVHAGHTSPSSAQPAAPTPLLGKDAWLDLVRLQYVPHLSPPDLQPLEPWLARAGPCAPPPPLHLERDLLDLIATDRVHGTSYGQWKALTWQHTPSIPWRRTSSLGQQTGR